MGPVGRRDLRIKTWKPAVAGALNILSGILWILGTIFLFLVALGFSVGFGAPTGIRLIAFWLIFTALGLLGLLDMVGGILSLRRKKWALALISSVCTIPVGLGIVSAILIALSRREFE